MEDEIRNLMRQCGQKPSPRVSPRKRATNNPPQPENSSVLSAAEFGAMSTANEALQWLQTTLKRKQESEGVLMPMNGAAISKPEFEAGLLSIGVVLEHTAAEKLFKTMDQQNSGTISMPEVCVLSHPMHAIAHSVGGCCPHADN